MKNEHGANVFELSEKLGISQKKILDFSSNINPFGASEKAKKEIIKNIDMVSIYPDPNYKKLKKAIS
ncbi:MAG: threonine-phosphate decarboxylase, partial [Fusobacteriaceae bacterium]